LVKLGRIASGWPTNPEELLLKPWPLANGPVTIVCTGGYEVGWRFTFIGMVTATLLLLLLFLFSGDPTLYLLFFVAPCVALLTIVLLLLLIVRRTRRRSAELLLATVAFLGAGIIGLRFEGTLRPKVRWAFFSHKFKLQVLGQPNQPRDAFKHLEWDGWGGAPVGDWTAYVVFDPADSLNTAVSGKVRGIPCDVQNIKKLEPQWYSVTLQVNQWWEQCTNDSLR
jgi:hypothetical protein